jgi:hypothetical protein
VIGRTKIETSTNAHTNGILCGASMSLPGSTATDAADLACPFMSASVPESDLHPALPRNDVMGQPESRPVSHLLTTRERQR